MTAPLCLHCGVVRIKRGGVKYCSRACGHLAQRKPIPICGWCESRPASRSSGRYCSRTCSGRAHGANMATLRRRRCPWCQQMFTPRRAKGVACSKTCAMRIRAMRTDPSRLKAMAAKAHAAMLAKREAIWEQRTAGMTPGQAAAWGYRKGYGAGYQRGLARHRSAA